MSIERIVSFLPSATELLYELGVQDKLYGVTHECLYPNDASSKPRVINSVYDTEKMTSKQIDQTTTEFLREGKDIFVLDENNITQANPDLIISQETCEVCAAYTNQVNKAIQILNKKPRIHSMDPHDVNGILNTITDIAKILDKEEEGHTLRDSLFKRINFIKNQDYKHRPRILAIEWIEPFFTSGHWIPEMIEYAGGRNQVSKVGEHSRRMSFEEIVNSEPEIIILMPCGFDISRTIKEYNEVLKADKKWNELQAVKTNNVFAVNANSFFSKPSIRAITGLEVLAKIIHSDIFGEVNVPENSFKKIKNY